ncbi:sigma-70 family RNA polymerase sigma factor [Candidatus Poribacteria bacterium]|nr:sigma-70 family RNA polymerase sigma factor [Candidatus Poribacteria bacterium]MYK19026.1 sigma-70 family RNA polymerase sigma factor [Candidatus Poribacteria bacterium]
MQTHDYDLIRRVLDGDENAFTVLVKKHQKWIHTLVWQKIGDFHIAEEITQDVFLKAYKKLPILKPPYNFAGWLYVIATRRCIAWLRKKQPRTTSLDAMPAAQIEELSYVEYDGRCAEDADLEFKRAAVKRLLEKLPESERTVVTMHYLSEMPCEKISESLGVSPNTVKSRLHRARQRLAGQEALLHETSGVFQVPPTLTANIMKKVARIQPTPPPAGKPLSPWVFSVTSTLLLILVTGLGTRALFRFQQPYSLDATAEMTIELVEAPVVLPLKLKPDARTQLGNADVPGRDSGTGQQPGPSLIPRIHPKDIDAPAKPGWIQAKGPEGVSAPGLFRASDKSFYAVMKSGLYRLTAQADAWELISPSGPNREFSRAMVEREDTFYLLASDELLASTDNGKIWTVLGSRPEGDPVALIITGRAQERSPQSADMTMYLILKTEIYRSEDTGKKWESIGDVLRSNLETDNPDFRIWDARAVDNTLFVGTSQGLFLFADGWEKVPVPTPHGINSLAVVENRLYVGTRVNPQYSLTPQVFYSTDLGDSWTDITPAREHSTKMITQIRVVSVGKTLMLIGFKGVLLSYDCGKTWMDPGDNHAFGPFPTVALDENNFYRANYAEIIRSTDGGFTWHPFMTGLVSSNVRQLTTLKNTLYAVTNRSNFVKSKDGGESWDPVNMVDGHKLSVTRLEATDTTLYVSSSGRNKPQFFHLSADDDMLIPVQGVPDFKEDDLATEWRKRLQKARETGVKVRETEELWRKSISLIAEEDGNNGGFTVAGETVFMEHRRKLFRWRFGETAWSYTGLEDQGEPPLYGKGFTLGTSGNVVYAGKRDGHLFQSLDNGNTWSDITENLAFPFTYFKEIVVVGSTVYILTDVGVMNSYDATTWHAVSDIDSHIPVMNRIATDGSRLYGVCDTGVYQVNNHTNTWRQITSEVPSTTVTSLAATGGTLYIGTEDNGVFRLQHTHPEFRVSNLP